MSEVVYLELADYVAIASEVTGTNTEDLDGGGRLELADSALHAPMAGFGDEDFYPDFIDKAAVLCTRLIKNHPLPDGNKRSAWVTLRIFLDLNRWTWTQPPEVDEAHAAVVAVAAGDWDERALAAWLRPRLTGPA